MATVLYLAIVSALKNTPEMIALSQFASSASTVSVLPLAFVRVPIFGTDMLATLLFVQLAAMGLNALRMATVLVLVNANAWTIGVAQRVSNPFALVGALTMEFA